MVTALLGDDFGAADLDPTILTMGGLSLDDDEEDDPSLPYDLNSYYGMTSLNSYGNPIEINRGSSEISLSPSFNDPFTASPVSGSPSFYSFSSSSTMNDSSTASSFSGSTPVVASGKEEAFEMLASMFSDYERYHNSFRLESLITSSHLHCCYVPHRDGLQLLFDANDKDMERTVAIILEIEREENDSNSQNSYQKVVRTSKSWLRDAMHSTNSLNPGA